MSQNLQTIVQNLISDEIDVPSITVNGLSINSKNTQAGDLFIAIPGTVSDGHDYINQSIDNGAVAVITNGRDLGQLPVPQIKVANPRRAASFIAAEFYNHPSKELTIIGITGTNGKTTTACIITSILRQAGFKTAQMGTLGLLAEGFPKDKNLTTENPISLHKRFSDLKKAGFTHVVMEVSSHALQQYRVTDVDFNYAIFTNLTPEHLDYHHTMEEYSYAKSKLFKGLALDATAIINMDDQFGEKIKSDCTCPVLSFSQSSKEDAHYSEYDISVEGIKATIGIGEIQYQINSYLTGKFNLENILASVALAHVMGVDEQFIEEGVSNCKHIPGRMEVFTLKNGGKAIIDYAHTPDAYEKTISTIRELMVSDDNLTIVFGAGGERDRTKRPLMGAIVDQYADMSYVVPDNPRSEKLDDINNQIVAGYTSDNYKIYNDRGEGLKDALKNCQINDVVVVLGKGREESQEIDGVKQFYSDFEIIEEFL